MAIELYGLKGSMPCWAVEILGRNLGLEFNFHEIDVLVGAQHEEEFLKVTFVAITYRSANI